jgi:glycosyltransferase 2 family protein
MPDTFHVPPASKKNAASSLPVFGVGKLIIGGVIFVLITLGFFWYLFYRIGPGADAPEWADLRWGYLLLIILFLPQESLLSGFRMWVVCRVLQPEISFWTCLKADLANTGISILTPSQTGGGPGQMYVLNRGGARLATALTISLLTFSGTMVALLGLGFYTLFISEIEETGPLFTGALSTLTFFGALMVLSALLPGFFRLLIGAASRMIWRLWGGKYALEDWWPPAQPHTGPPVDRMDYYSAMLATAVYTYQSDLTRYVRRGKLSFIAVCLLSLIFLMGRAILAYFCVRFLGIEDSSIGEIFDIQLALLFFTYLAPTPGSAGIAEAVSLWFMEDIVSSGYASYYNLLWRFSTTYLAAAAGLLLILFTILQDMIKGFLNRHWQKKSHGWTRGKRL